MTTATTAPDLQLSIDQTVEDLSVVEPFDPVLGMCTATSPYPRRHGWCRLPFGHLQPAHDWCDEYTEVPR